MGTWDYFVVKMSVSELSQNVMYASEVHEDFVRLIPQFKEY